MSNKVLARKWRPQKFSDVVGQDHVVRALMHGLKNENLHHAYLLTGTRGVGKTTLARILAKAANCINLQENCEPCGECTQCMAIENGNFPDLLELDAATNTGIDHMRELQENLAYPPYSGKKKVYVIDEVHMLSTQAFNAMLKTFEEPPEYLVFVLATTDPHKVPVTVLSRCLQFNLKALPETLLIEHYKKILIAEKIDFEDTALPLIARAADGSVRDGLSLIDQLIAQGDGRIITTEVVNILGVIGHDWAMPTIEKILSKQTNELINCAEDLQLRSLDFDSALIEIAKNILAIQIVQMGGPCPSLINQELAYEFAQKVSAEELQLLYQIVVNGRKDLPFAPDAKSGFLITMLRMMSFSQVLAPKGVFDNIGNQNINTAQKKTPKLAEQPENHSAHVENPVGYTKTEAKNIKYNSDNELSTKTGVIKTTKNAIEINKLINSWAELILQLNNHSSLKIFIEHIFPHKINQIDNQHYQLVLTVANEEQHQLEDGSAEKFAKSLQKYYLDNFGINVICEFKLGALAENSFAFQKQKIADENFEYAINLLENNPSIQKLKKEFNINLIPESVEIKLIN